MTEVTLTINGEPVRCASQSTLMEACSQAGVYVPHLCYHEGLSPHGSCRLCIVEVNQQTKAACTTPVSEGAVVNTETATLNHMRLRLTQLLFIEGNHFCPSCEFSGNCQLQAVAYHLGMHDNHFAHAFPRRNLDASHPDLVIDRDRCIVCALCVRASHENDGKNAFQLAGRGPATTLDCNSDSGLLVDTALTGADSACHICPVGALLPRKNAYIHPIGQRLYDNDDIASIGNQRPEFLDEKDCGGHPA